MRGEILSALLGGLSGLGQGVQQQRAFKMKQDQDAFERQRATESDALRNEMLRTQIDAMRAKPQPTAQPWKFDSDRGVFYNDAGEVKEIPGVSPKAKPKRTQLVKDQRGMMVSVDLDSGLGPDGKPVRAWQEPEKPVKQGMDALPPAQQNRVKTEQSTIMNLHKALRNLDDAVSKHGLEVMPGADKQTMQALMKEAQLQYKEAANLGVLNGPDLKLIEEALGNVTSPTQFLFGGAKGVRNSLSVALNALRGKAGTMESIYGVRMPEEFYGTEPPATATPPQPQVTDLLKAASPVADPLHPDSWLTAQRAKQKGPGR